MAVLLPMFTARRFIALLVTAIILRYFFFLSSNDDDQFSPLDNIDEEPHPMYNCLQLNPNASCPRANATFVIVAHNGATAGLVNSIQSIEDRFNRVYNYPWVILNEEPFSEEFKERISVLTRAPIFFGQIQEWGQPAWIDERRAVASRQRMMSKMIIYGGSVPFRNMLRFNAGFFYRHELLQPYRYYWRVDPDVRYFCDIDYDPFLYMQENNKVYGFTMALKEAEWIARSTIPTLWSAMKEFITAHPHYVKNEKAMEFFTDGDGKYNLCRFWSNFEIADMDFWRSKPYTEFFDYLDRKGGFYYERWSDGPIHSVAAALFADKEKIHFFDDFGYRHQPFQHCPHGEQWKKGRCSCNPSETFELDYPKFSCLDRFEKVFSSS